jgi:hypothetical protein
MRFYLPLLHDIMALEKPALVVTLGLADARSRYPCERSRAIVPRSQLHGEKMERANSARSVLQPKLVASFARF